MRQCCIKMFAEQAVRDNFRVAEDGERFTCPECGCVHQKRDGKFVTAQRVNVLAIYTVYANPRDYPGEFVVRRTLVLEGGAAVPDAQLWARCKTLADARSRIPLGVVLFPRQPEDDPAIVETWL